MADNKHFTDNISVFDDKKYMIIDTSRHCEENLKVEESLEYWLVLRAIKTIGRKKDVCLLIDGQEVTTALKTKE